MTEMTQAYDWRGRTLIGSDGEKIGKVDEVYLDEQSRQPEWARVTTGLFGTHSSFVPLAGARPQGEDVVVSVTKDQAKDSPRVEQEAELSQEQEAELFGHYGLDYTEEGSVTATERRPDSGPASAQAETAASEAPAPPPEPAREATHGPEGEATHGPAGRDVSGPTTDDAMTRSQEELHVGTAERERGRARLRKYVVTEHVEATVPVQREEVRLEREPITDANVEAAVDGPEISDEEHEVVLHEEVAVVEKRTVPKERVRMSKDVVTEEEAVSEEVRRERIEAEGDGPGGA